jgi:cleavage and polyadenylation specificity factor subunit 4
VLNVLGMRAVFVNMVSRQANSIDQWLTQILGPSCRNKHIRKVICQLYVNGFCPQGPECPNGHPKYELPIITSYSGDRGGSIHDRARGGSSNSGGGGGGGSGGESLNMNVDVVVSNSSTMTTPSSNQDRTERTERTDRGKRTSNTSGQTQREGHYRPIQEVQCFKCGQMGHYANRCPS